jgi:hypothetical protein
MTAEATEIQARFNGAHEFKARGARELVRTSLEIFDRDHGHVATPVALYDLVKMMIRGGVEETSDQLSTATMAGLALWVACRVNPEARPHALEGGCCIGLDIMAERLEPGLPVWADVTVVRLGLFDTPESTGDSLN